MNTKRRILSWFGALAVSASMAFGAPHGGHGNGARAGTMQGGSSVARSGPAISRSRGFQSRSNYYRWNGSGGNWNHHHHGGTVVFFDGFGYPFYPYWGWDYPYGYYPYGYSPYGYYNYYYGEPGYADNDHGYAGASIAAQLQERLARAGYYRGNIDGVIGPATRRAIRAYESDHGMPVDGRLSQRLLERMDLR